jgi:hypothetical protein
MKNKIHLVALILLLVIEALVAPHACQAQTEEIIQAKTVHRKLTIGFDPASFKEVRYVIDDQFAFSDAKILPNGGTIAVAADDQLNILGIFANPLVYKMSFSQSSKEDPSVKATSDFLNLFGQVFSQIGAISSTKDNPASTVPIKTENTTSKADARVNFLPTANQDVLVNKPSVRSPEVLNLILWLYSAGATKTNSGVQERAKNIIGTLTRAEDNLYSFPDATRQLVKSLTVPVTHEEVKNALVKIKEDYKNLKLQNDKAEKLSDSLIHIGSDGLYSRAVLKDESTAELVRPLEAFVRSTVTTYANTFAEKVKTRNALLVSIEALIKSLDSSFSNKGYKNEDERFTMQSTIDSEKGMIKQVDVVISKIDIQFIDNTVVINENKVYASTIRVRPYSLLVLEASAGVLFTNLSYPDFGTGIDSNGKTIVADAGAQRVNVVPSAMLNIFLMRGRSDALPIFQLGIGTGHDSRPTIFTGVGLRFFTPNKLTFSIGTIFPFYQTLGALKMGQEVTGTAQVKSDLKYELSAPKLALGIQYIIN